MELSGKHLIAGEWVETSERFASDPAHGEAHSFSAGTTDLVARACSAAEDAFWTFGYSTRQSRADLLNTIAEELVKLTDDIVAIGSQETGLPTARLQGELGRTTGQLKLFASHILEGDYLDERHDAALPDRAPMPRPEIRMVQRPIGPVAVFGASNFPLAFSTAGGDTAAALAAGCPVVVRGHHAHPGTSELVAAAIDAALKKLDLHPGVFSLVQGGGLDVGQALVQHPLIKAVGFTGSLRGGRALFDLCAQRPEPIPFFGELGSVNPMFMMPEAMNARAADIATGWAASLTMGAGQFCTNPGVVVVLDGENADVFEQTAAEALKASAAQTMLTDGIANAYVQGREHIKSLDGAKTLLTSDADAPRSATPSLFVTTGAEWLADESLGEEVFGPLGVIVRVADLDEMKTLALNLEGQLTCTLQMDDGDLEAAQALMPILERKAGRILANGFPTGVEVCDAMVHGGPYPASTNFGATSVGTLAIRRFVRPVSYQNLAEGLLPKS